MVEGAASSVMVLAKGDSSFIFLIIAVWIIVGIINAVVRKAAGQRPTNSPPQPADNANEPVDTGSQPPEDEFKEFLDTLRKQTAPATQEPEPPPTPAIPTASLAAGEPRVEVRITTRTAAVCLEAADSPPVDMQDITLGKYGQPTVPLHSRPHHVGNLRSPQAWARAVIMRELLAPPLALRPLGESGDIAR